MKLTTTKSIRFTKQQIEAFEQLEKYNVNVSKFIRLAISEKIKRDWKSIKEKKERIYCPF
jgi:phage regulator Rha-like protein